MLVKVHAMAFDIVLSSSLVDFSNTAYKVAPRNSNVNVCVYVLFGWLAGWLARHFGIYEPFISDSYSIAIET